jgi:hypothetical protein
MVREYQDWPNDDLTLVLEAHKSKSDHDDPLLEQAISLAATICWEWCRQSGDRLVLVVAGATLTVREGMTGQALARGLLERLALEPGAAEIDADAVISALHTCRLPTGPIAVISPSPSGLAARLESALRRRTAPVALGSREAAPFFEP